MGKNKFIKSLMKVPSKQETQNDKETELPKVFGVPQVYKKGNTTTILFETGKSVFYSYTRKECVREPDVLVLHKNNEGKFLMTWHGMVEYTCAKTLDVFDLNACVDYFFGIKGMHELNGQQAKALLTAPENLELFRETLAGIKKQENLEHISLTEDARKQRYDFIKNDLKLAERLKDKYLDAVKTQDAPLKQRIEEQKKAQAIIKRINSNGK